LRRHRLHGFTKLCGRNVTRVGARFGRRSAAGAPAAGYEVADADAGDLRLGAHSTASPITRDGAGVIPSAAGMGGSMITLAIALAVLGSVAVGFASGVRVAGCGFPARAGAAG
jgi:hypothetical protein